MDPDAWKTAGLVFACFCIASSAVYIANDLHDVDQDRGHRRKHSRPLPAGRIRPGVARMLMVACLVGCLVAARFGPPPLLAAVLAYLANNLLYNAWLKRVPILDVLSITVGFVLRLLAGIYTLGDVPTAWIMMCVFFLACFLGFAKRRAELSAILERSPAGIDPASHRPVLAGYTVEYLDFLVSSTATMTVLSYALFATISHKNPSLIFTVPFVFYAVMHYQRMLMTTSYGEEPDAAAIGDIHLVATGLLWFATFMAIWIGGLHVVK
jgi:4-hydroxybenzoate polyprenyltransferase